MLLELYLSIKDTFVKLNVNANDGKNNIYCCKLKNEETDK